MRDDLDGDVESLSFLTSSLFGLAKRAGEDAVRSDRMTDVYMYGALKRALFIADGFQQMVERRNLICAGALLRLQLDTVLRVGALFLVKSPEDFARKVVEGRQVNNLKDAAGRTMTDRYLLDHAGTKHPWLSAIYDASSGFVHLSYKHLYSDQSPIAEEREDIVEVDLLSLDSASDGVLRQAANSFARVSDLLEGYAKRWTRSGRT